MNDQNKVWECKKSLENFINKNYLFFTFKLNEKVDKLEIDLRKEDFVMQILIKAHTKLHLYNFEKSSLTTWINNIATKQYIDWYRNKKVEQNYKYNLEESVVENKFTELDLAIFEEYLLIQDISLYNFYYLRKQNLGFNKSDFKTKKKVICEKLQINSKQYNKMLKHLNQMWNEFNS